MPRNLILLALSCLLVILNISCQKDVSGDGNAGETSSYTFAGTPSGCSAPVIAGTYTVGTAMTASNTITFSVNVTVKGSYSIKTTSANGVYFSGIGSFAATGLQTVVLTGIGTPIAMGNFSFVPVANNSCNFNVIFSASGPPAVFTYAGAPNNCTTPIISGTYVKGVNLGPGNYVDLAVNVTTPGAYTIATNNTNNISFWGTGVFTATGPQVVRLMGIGTPELVSLTTFRPSVNGCSFVIIVTPSAASAAFSYNGGSGDCVGVVRNGTYTAGVPLNATNTIIINVNVSAPGSYSVNTSSFNGVVFSASGNFTTTGPNTITLTSNNTPINPGNAPYVLPNGCSFGVFYSDPLPPPPTDFLKCTIDGMVTTFNDNLWGASQQTTSPYSFDLNGMITGGGPEKMTINIRDTISPIVPGPYNNVSISNMNIGCIVTYFQSVNVVWATSVTNLNTFVINMTSITATRATGTFSGTLYLNVSGPATKTITNGSFSIGY